MAIDQETTAFRPFCHDPAFTPDYPHQIAVNEYGFYSIPQEFAQNEVPSTLLRGEVYEPATLRLLCRLAGEGDVISGGAFVGDFLPALSRALAPGAQLHSFEPNPVSFKAAKHTIALNGLSNVRLWPCAIGSEASELPLLIAKSETDIMGARARLTSRKHGGERVMVPVRRMETMVPLDRPISVLHLDVEGFEVEALTGALPLVERWRPVLVLEAPRKWHLRHYATILADLVPDCGYAVAGTMERNAFFLPSGRAVPFADNLTIPTE